MSNWFPRGHKNQHRSETGRIISFLVADITKDDYDKLSQLFPRKFLLDRIILTDQDIKDYCGDPNDKLNIDRMPNNVYELMTLCVRCLLRGYMKKVENRNDDYLQERKTK